MTAATARLGNVPHPSLAMIDEVWFEEVVGDAEYVKITADGKQCGTLQVVDTGLRTTDSVAIHPRAWLDPRPVHGQAIDVAAADEADYLQWRKRHTSLRRVLFWIALGFGVLAGVIEMAWAVGEFWVAFIPSTFWAGLSHLLKWFLIGIGVAGITAYRDYRKIE